MQGKKYPMAICVNVFCQNTNNTATSYRLCGNIVLGEILILKPCYKSISDKSVCSQQERNCKGLFSSSLGGAIDP